MSEPTEYTTQIQSKEVAREVAYHEKALREIGSHALNIEVDSIDEIEATSYEDALAIVSQNPEGYARLIKEAQEYKRHFTGSELRRLLLGLAVVGDFPKTDTSDRRYTLKRHDTVSSVSMGDGHRGKVVETGGSFVARNREDSILMGELPTYGVGGSSLAEVTESLMFVNFYHKTPGVGEFTAEQADILKRLMIETKTIDSSSNNVSYEMKRESDWLRNNSHENLAFSEQEVAQAKAAIYEAAIAKLKEVYLRCDAELADSGISL